MIRKIGSVSMVLLIVGMFIGLMGCDAVDPLSGYNPEAGIGIVGVPEKDGSVAVALSDAFPWEKVVTDPGLLAILNGDDAKLAPASTPTIWFRSNAIMNSEKTGYEEREGSINGQAVLPLRPNTEIEQDGYENYWIIARNGSSSGNFYYWLKLPDGSMPTNAEVDGKLRFRVDTDGSAHWLNTGNLILSRTIVVENLAITSSANINVRGDKSTLGQWLKMDYDGTSRRTLKVMASAGRETLEIKDDSGKRYRYKVTVDGIVVTYGDPNNNRWPTFEYLETTGVRNLGNNLSYDIGVTVADNSGGGAVIPDGGNVNPVDNSFLAIVSGKLVIADISKAPVPLLNAARIFMPNSCNAWVTSDTNYSANVQNNRWEFDLNQAFSSKQKENQIIRFNLFAGGWLIKDACTAHPGWAQVKQKPVDWSLAIVYKGGQWKWWQDVYGSAQVDENP